MPLSLSALYGVWRHDLSREPEHQVSPLPLLLFGPGVSWRSMFPLVLLPGELFYQHDCLHSSSPPNPQFWKNFLTSIWAATVAGNWADVPTSNNLERCTFQTQSLCGDSFKKSFSGVGSVFSLPYSTLHSIVSVTSWALLPPSSPQLILGRLDHYHTQLF